jgi:DNA-binding transcriptional regulator/RsmH inhibitor MraZ
MKVYMGVNVCQKNSKNLKKSQSEARKSSFAEQKEMHCTQRTGKMSGEFLGTFENSIHKSRIMIPASFKKKFAVEANKMAIVTIGPEGTVAVFPLDTWMKMREQLEVSTEADDKELLDNLIEFSMPEQELEGPGRVRISDELLKMANISDFAKIKGEGHFITLWNPERLEAIRQQKVAQHKEKYPSSSYQIKRKI